MELVRKILFKVVNTLALIKIYVLHLLDTDFSQAVFFATFLFLFSEAALQKQLSTQKLI